MGDIFKIKDGKKIILTRDDIDKLTDTDLYNILFGEAAKWKSKIESGKYGKDGKDSVAVAVYGATIVPIMRRINALDKLSEFIDLINIILSGGISWSFNPNTLGYTGKEEYREFIHNFFSKDFKEYMEFLKEKEKNPAIKKPKKFYSEWIGTKVPSIMRKIPVIKQVAQNRMKEEFINNRLSQMGIDIEYVSCIDSIRSEGDNNSNSLRQELEKEYEDFYNEIKQNIIKDISKNEEILKLLYDKYIKGQKMFKGYEKWKSEFLKNGIEEYVDDYIVSQYILNRMTEADFMEIDWKFYHNGEEKGSNIIKDEKACDSSDNARNTIMEFVKLRKKNPGLKTLIVISEWPYLQRQVLTTRKIASEMGYNDIEIIGYPADSEPGIGIEFDNMDKYRNGVVNGIKTNILKLLYPDCGDFDITNYINLNGIIPGGPRIMVTGKEFDGTVAGNDERE